MVFFPSSPSRSRRPAFESGAISQKKEGKLFMNFKPQPFMGHESKLQSERLPILANAPFYLTHHPIQWELVEEGKKLHWLPILSKLHEIPGVQGVQAIRGGGADSTHAQARAMKQGKTILPWSLGYLTRYPAKGGFYYCIKFSIPKKLGRNVLTKLDQKAWNAFRRDLIVNGHIEPMDEDMIPIFVQEQQRSLENLYRQQHIPEIKERIDEIYSTIEKMKKASMIKGAA